MTKKLPSVKRTPMFPPRQVLSHKGNDMSSRIDETTKQRNKQFAQKHLIHMACYNRMFSVGSLCGVTSFKKQINKTHTCCFWRRRWDVQSMCIVFQTAGLLKTTEVEISQ